MTDQQQAVQSIVDWFLHVGQDDDYYRGESGKVHARRDAEALYRSVVAPLLAERDAEIAGLSASLDHVEDTIADLLDDYGLTRPESLPEALDAVHEAFRLGAWLEAEAMWLACKEQSRRERAEASRRDWAAEALRLREMLERLENVALDRNAIFSGILVGVGGEHDTPPRDEQTWRAVGLIERAIRRAMGTGYVTQAEARLVRAVESTPVCSCAVDFAALDPERWSPPLCSVHPDGRGVFSDRGGQP